MALLEVRNLSFAYNSTIEHLVLDNISFSAERGEIITLCGPTGSGKSTLMRLLKRELRPAGRLSGSVTLDGKLVDAIDEGQSVSRIGYVCQRPEQQIVTDKVWHELAFGLENIGIPKSEMRCRVAEMAAYFGIEEWFDKKTDELSGGQKQLLNLASVMIMRPDVLLLDEPTSQLDPIAAESFISTVKKLNRDLSVTVVIIEHRLEDILPVCDKVLALENGMTLVWDNTRSAISQLSSHKIMNHALPSASRLFSQLKTAGQCPISVSEGRSFIETYCGNEIRSLSSPKYEQNSECALEFDEVYFRYSKQSRDVLNCMSLKIYCGEIFCLLGGNGSGKSTALSAASGIIRPYSGHIKVFGKKIKDYKNQSLYSECLSLLPQDVQTVFLCNTVEEELRGIDASSLPYDISTMLPQHPYDLSGGQQQLVAMAKVLSLKPRLLLLDEPTKGLDAASKLDFIRILKELKANGVTIVCVTHDAEFAAELADRCAMLFRGEVISVNDTRAFFAGNSFYTTAEARMTRGYYDEIITHKDLVAICKQNAEAAK